MGSLEEFSFEQKVCQSVLYHITILLNLYNKLPQNFYKDIKKFLYTGGHYFNNVKVGWLEFNIPLQHKYDYIRDDQQCQTCYHLL